MAVTDIKSDSVIQSKRKNSETKYVRRALATALIVPRQIHARGGGASTLSELAAHLDYRGTDNGAFKEVLSSAFQFGLIEKSGDRYVLSQLAQSILMPVYEWMPKEGLVKAFFNVELFAKVYAEYDGKALSPEFGLKNALKTMFGISPNAIETAYRVLMESAETAGLFEVRGGARTHLIIPTVRKGSTPPVFSAITDLETQAGGGDGGGNGNGGGDGGDREARPDRQQSASLDAVKARYIQTLIDAHEKKAADGNLDEALMARIEKLLQIE